MAIHYYCRLKTVLTYHLSRFYNVRLSQLLFLFYGGVKYPGKSLQICNQVPVLNAFKLQAYRNAPINNRCTTLKSFDVFENEHKMDLCNVCV